MAADNQGEKTRNENVDLAFLEPEIGLIGGRIVDDGRLELAAHLESEGYDTER